MRIWLVLLVLFIPLHAQADTIDTRVATITVQGEAMTKIAPDEVTLPVTVEQEDSNLKVAKQKHDDKLRALLKLASDTGIPTEKIQTNFTSINPVYDYKKGSSKPILRGYTVQTSLDFKLTDFSKLGDFMQGIVNLDIDNVGSVSYSLQDEDKVKDDTLVKALQHAYSKASRLAATANVAIDKPVTITEGGASINQSVRMPAAPAPMMMSMADTAPRAPEMPAGLIEIHQSVTVTYQLK